MTTSGVTEFTSTGDQIIEDAFDHVRVTQKGQTFDDEDVRKARRKLNNIVTSWKRDGIHLWKDEEAALFLNIGQREYTIGPDANATLGDWATTTIAANALTDAFDIDLTSAAPTGYSGTAFTIQDGDHIGIVNDDGVMQWTTICLIVDTDVALDDALTGDVTSGNTIFVYRKRTTKPMKIYPENIRLWQSNTYELPIHLLAFTDYNLLPQKDITGVIVQAFYSPKKTVTNMAIWPTSDTLENVILFRFQSPMEIFVNSADLSDLPDEWTRPLGWALAAEIGPSKGVPIPRQQILDARASSLYEDVLDWDQDDSSIFLQPRRWGTGGMQE